jgi:hypothetical protein
MIAGKMSVDKTCLGRICKDKIPIDKMTSSCIENEFCTQEIL